ncbi:MAG: rhomboid family intramembrane serine protease [Anaerosomatales bacterium]|nr:rhomboid family intramembrane serine protease [Anaerosomatales bacterium]MDT8433146.1 rhomboid family intramembrane serine protease [Anaerosomatales bacterium]
MIPIRDDNPTRRFPLVTAALLVANAAVFAYEVSLPDAEFVAFLNTWALTPARLAAEPFSPAVLITLVTAMFLHGGWLHLGGNMLYLWIFGNNVEDTLGRLKFLAFYLATGVIATLAHVVVSGPSEVPLVGASGAIAGILAAYLLLFPKAHVLVLIPVFFIIELARVPATFVIGFWFVLQLVQGIGSISPAGSGGVAWWAHIGGFAAGLLLTLPAWLARRRLEKRRKTRFTTWR